jgi:2-polyprenyl-3-methyl-5-hydroxy-6-metoxy-1,4-benzoquinol methylase
MPIHKNDFDAASYPDIRATLAHDNQAMRHEEKEMVGKLLDERGDFLPEVSLQRDCPLCGASHEQGKPLLRAHGMQLLRCPDCGLVYSREIFRPEFERQYYGDNVSGIWISRVNNPVYARLAETKSRYIIERLTCLSDVGNLLDIGCSTGTLLKAAQEAGWMAYGVEPNPLAARQGQQENLKVICAHFPCTLPTEISGNAGGLQAVVLLDVLEHIADPNTFLGVIYQALKPGGWLVVQVPNFRSLLWRIEGARNHNVCHGHWSYFESATLVALLSRNGFEMRFLETYITELDKILTYPDATIAAAWEKLLGTPLVQPRQLDAECLHVELLGYKLFGLFRKVPT